MAFLIQTDLEPNHGIDFFFEFRWLINGDPDTPYAVLTDYGNAKMQVRKTYLDSALLTLTTPIGITLDDQGYIRGSVNGSDMAGLPVGKLRYDLILVDSLGVKLPFASGAFNVLPTITQI